MRQYVYLTPPTRLASINPSTVLYNLRSLAHNFVCSTLIIFVPPARRTPHISCLIIFVPPTRRTPHISCLPSHAVAQICMLSPLDPHRTALASVCRHTPTCVVLTAICIVLPSFDLRLPAAPQSMLRCLDSLCFWILNLEIHVRACLMLK
ncbi:unnamed protein product [Citrullus colocynthis]|uniref:Uncharacterized protein n=1 Tax=Citrullus colocynthis TaxID=252529 RepID=A0ABP0YPH4_9ROSI